MDFEIIQLHLNNFVNTWKGWQLVLEGAIHLNDLSSTFESDSAAAPSSVLSSVLEGTSEARATSSLSSN
ncbi:hypothetical protein G7Y29_09320 [Corynebacterium qintianiae]|uniref:Uncharacterized protein n=1 Tax=Corynebacterium qintianiae TaxID=2709392 RepID=A0A7T0KNF0_9CORY|nr:hypothetical protein [Corynebacterium qintianiae]QPK83028.1 hypothetical protein G7Y29_09320 [Corynebacterium qintianiae]